MIYHVFFNCFAMTSSIFKYALVCTLLANSTAYIFASQATPPLIEDQIKNPNMIQKIDQIIERLEKVKLFDDTEMGQYIIRSKMNKYIYKYIKSKLQEYIKSNESLKPEDIFDDTDMIEKLHQNTCVRSNADKIVKSICSSAILNTTNLGEIVKQLHETIFNSCISANIKEEFRQFILNSIDLNKIVEQLHTIIKDCKTDEIDEDSRNFIIGTNNFDQIIQKIAKSCDTDEICEKIQQSILNSDLGEIIKKLSASKSIMSLDILSTSNSYKTTQNLCHVFKEFKEMLQSNQKYIKYPIDVDYKKLINDIYYLLQRSHNCSLTIKSFFELYTASVLLQSYIFYQNNANSPFWSTLTKAQIVEFIEDFSFLKENLDLKILGQDSLNLIADFFNTKLEFTDVIVNGISIFRKCTSGYYQKISQTLLKKKYKINQNIETSNVPTIIKNINKIISCISPCIHHTETIRKLNQLALELYNLPKNESVYINTNKDLILDITTWYKNFLKFLNIDQGIDPSKYVANEPYDVLEQQFKDQKITKETFEKKCLQLDILTELENWIKTCHQDPYIIKEQIKQLLEEINKNATLNADTELLYDAVVAQYLKQFNSLINNKISNETSLDNLKIILEKLLEIAYGGEWKFNSKETIQQQFLIYLAQNAPTASTDNIQQPQNALSADDIQQLLYNYFIPELGKDCAKLVSTHFSR